MKPYISNSTSCGNHLKSKIQVYKLPKKSLPGNFQNRKNQTKKPSILRVSLFIPGICIPSRGPKRALIEGQSVATKAAQAVAAAVATGMPSVPQPVSETAPVAAAFVGTSVAWC